MPTMIVRCANCRREFSPAIEDYAGGVWRACPACRTAAPTERSTPRRYVVDEPHPAAVNGECQYTMKGRTRRRKTKAGAIHRAGWQQGCPNTATIVHRGRRYCEMHRPAASVRAVARANEETTDDRTS
ncbi:MAG: hypothetical protein H0W06_00445 [Chloroflexia bacterium]|nr:hypothetical protein [Chloroflexia bacterium]